MDSSGQATDLTVTSKQRDGVSVCIPTYRRPALLREAVLSAVANALRPLEILVSDDDLTEESRRATSDVTVPEGIVLRHVAGPALRSQAANVNALLNMATYERVVLLHDDDLLTPGAIDRMAAAWSQHAGEIDAVYGQQEIISMGGAADAAATRNNAAYYFKDVAAGAQTSNLWAALVSQFPNDGMMMRKSLAMRVGYPGEAGVGRVPVDFHFGLRYALASTKPFVLLHDITARYRNSDDSVLRSTRTTYDGHLGYAVLEQIPVSGSLEVAGKQIALERFGASAIMGYLATGQASEAMRVLRRHFGRLNKGWGVQLALAGLVLTERAGLPVLRWRLARAGKKQKS